MNQPVLRTLQMLIVEDNPIDVRLLRYALTYARDWQIGITVAEDGERAISLLSTDQYSPDYIVLDLNLPKRDGAEVLQMIRRTPSIQQTPVAIVSSSPLDVIRDRVTGAKVNADFYFTKPMHVDGFVELGRNLLNSYSQTLRDRGSDGTRAAGN